MDVVGLVVTVIEEIAVITEIEITMDTIVDVEDRLYKI